MNATRVIFTLLAATGLARAQTADVIDEIVPTTRPVDILAAPPGPDAGLYQPGKYPPGSYGVPGCGPNGCSGPVGKNGPMTYEIYSITGASMPVGGSELSSALKVGVIAGGGARTIMFDADRMGACILDLGVTYTYNRGQGDRTLQVATPRVSPIVVDPFTGQTSGGQRIFPDGIASYSIRGLNRTNFNFALGRDLWFWGPGDVASEEGHNVRAGVDVGGRWGTASIDLVPRENPANFLSRSGVTHSVFIGMHAGGEKPMGHWILTYGVRAEWGYTWTNIIPPNGGDIHDINILFTVGARF